VRRSVVLPSPWEARNIAKRVALASGRPPFSHRPHRPRRNWAVQDPPDRPPPPLATPSRPAGRRQGGRRAGGGRACHASRVMPRVSCLAHAHAGAAAEMEAGTPRPPRLSPPPQCPPPQCLRLSCPPAWSRRSRRRRGRRLRPSGAPGPGPCRRERCCRSSCWPSRPAVPSP